MEKNKNKMKSGRTKITLLRKIYLIYKIEKAGQSDGAVIPTRRSASVLQKTSLPEKKKSKRERVLRTTQLVKYF